MKAAATAAWIGGAALIACTAAATVRPAPPAQAVTARPAPAPAAGKVAWTRADALARSYVEAGKAPGIVLAIGRGTEAPTIIAQGRIAIEADARKVDGDTLWRVYSMTKPVTGMAAMMLVEDGKIGLDDPVSKYIPAFADQRVLTAPDATLDSRPAARPATIRHLLTHTAGLGYNIITKGPLLREYEAQGILPAALNLQMEGTAGKARAPSLEVFADRAGRLPLVADPGSKWSYSISLDILGRVIEVASGQPFDRFVQTRIFDPLGMRNSYWTVPADRIGNFATNYTFIGERLVPIDPANASVFAVQPSFPYGGAGLVMSARDYDAFLAMILNKGRWNGATLLKPETVALATSNPLPPDVFYGSVNANTGGAQAQGGYGAGGSVLLADSPGGGPRKGTYGWGGAAGTVAWVDPASNLRVTAMVNYFPPEKWPLRDDVIKAVYGDLAAAR